MIEYNTNKLHFLPLGGSGEIGMNLNLYHYGGKWLMVDMGISFNNSVGIDVVMPDTRYIEDYKEDIVGLVATHAHEDHIGAIPYLWSRFNCPIYATKFTAELIRKKMEREGLAKKVIIHEVDLGGTIDLDPFHIEFITLTHSIPEPNALAITTPAGIILHTGDWKLDDKPLVGEPTDKARLKEIGDKGVLALVCDSTNVFEEERTESEDDVRTSMIELIRKQENRVAVALFASNVARLETCAVAAAACNRKPALVGRSLHRMYEAAKKAGYLTNCPDFIKEDEAAKLPKNEVLLLCTGSQGEARAALSRITAAIHPVVNLSEGDTVIFSSRKIPGNEHSIMEMQTKLREKGVKVLIDGPEFTHVSGHPSKPELLEMYDLVRPNILVPVHGELIHMQAQALLGTEAGIKNAIVPFNGKVVLLEKDNPKIIDEVPSGRLCVDGKRIVSMTSHHLKERARIEQEGMAFVTVKIEADHNFVNPIVSFCGLTINKGDTQKLKDMFLKELSNALQKSSRKDFAADFKVEEVCHIAMHRAARELCGRKPYVAVHIIRGN